MYDVRRLRVLHELSVRGTLAEVATALSFSPSAVSQQLTQLEREVGVPLLRPAGRRVALTAAAELLVQHTRHVLDELERAETGIEALRAGDAETVGTVRLAVFQSAALALLPSALTALRRTAPGIRLEVVQHEPESALRDTWMRDFDLVVAEQYPGHATVHHEGLDRHVLLTDALRLAAPPDSAAIRLDDVRDAFWVMEPHGAASRHWAEQACRSAGFEPDVRFETPDLQAHMRLIESGHAVAVMPDLVWSDRGTSARLSPLPGAPVRTIVTAARRSGAGRPALVAVRDALSAAADGLRSRITERAPRAADG